MLILPGVPRFVSQQSHHLLHEHHKWQKQPHLSKQSHSRSYSIQLIHVHRIPSTSTKGSLVPKVEMPRIFIAAASAPGKPELCVTFNPVIPPCSDWDKDGSVWSTSFLSHLKKIRQKQSSLFFPKYLLPHSSNSSESEFKERLSSCL